jgi:hypothetical protein
MGRLGAVSNAPTLNAQRPIESEAMVTSALQNGDARKNFVERRHLFLVAFLRDPVGHGYDLVADPCDHEADRCRAELFVVCVPGDATPVDVAAFEIFCALRFPVDLDFLISKEGFDYRLLVI